MSSLTVAFLLLALTAICYQLGLVKSRAIERGLDADLGVSVRLHSRPQYHGWLAVLRAVVPAVFIYLAWSIFGGQVIDSVVLSSVPPSELPPTELEQKVFLQTVSNLASGFGIVGEARQVETEAAALMVQLQSSFQVAVFVLMSLVSAGGLFFTWKAISPDLRARNKVETAVRAGLIACATVAILTTLGIVLSMLGESLQFFQMVSPLDFFFGLEWKPAFATVGEGSTKGFGLLPLLSGTFLIALIAMIVAVPVGLMAAIYMAEYASSATRSWAKPIIEVLAGIPTIVYGFFALVTVGPFFADVGQILGIDIRATSALTAGVVMGIMIIPFISSLSDDIITQVPRTMRDGSLALGATKSETSIKVVLPAALPGVVGAILLALSRAIGETMIVVLAAGNSPVLTANPFEAVSTVTVSIVKQLTGDQDFASAQSLVAFALGLTLFAITLVLNIIALAIVRKYREQYD